MKSTCGNKARFEIELPLLHTKDEGDVCSPIWSVQYPYRMVFDCGININRMCWRIFSP